MKLQSNIVKECNLLPLLIKHKKQNYPTSTCTINAWPKESIDKAIEYLDKNKIKYEIINNKLEIEWK